MNIHRNENTSEWLVKQLFCTCTTTIIQTVKITVLCFQCILYSQKACQYFHLYWHKIQDVKWQSPSTHIGQSCCCTDNEHLFYRKLTYKMSCMFQMPYCNSDKCSSSLVARTCSTLKPSNQTETFCLHLSNWYIFQYTLKVFSVI